MAEHQQLEPIELRPLTYTRIASSSVQTGLDTYRSSPSMEDNRVGSSASQKAFHCHRDYFMRPFKGPRGKDKFLNPYDGRLCDLVVQSSGDLFSEPEVRWVRTRLRNGSPWMIRISNWALSRDHGSKETVGTDVREAILRWIPACFALAIVVSSG